MLLGSSNIPSIETCGKSIEITPNLKKEYFYSDTGGGSVEIAIKMAYQCWKNIDEKNMPRKTSL